MDIAALRLERADETAANVEELRPFKLGADILHIATKAGKILAENKLVASGRAQAAVEAVIDQ
ncbi:hypothetical protein D9M73_126320 [compost metagenome]